MFEKENENGSRAALGLERRSMPESKNEFLRCQLGKVVTERRQVPDWVTVTLFQLVGYGSTWEEAIAMVEARAQAQECSELARFYSHN